MFIGIKKESKDALGLFVIYCVIIAYLKL